MTLALSPLRNLIHYFRKISRPVIHVVRIYREDGSNIDISRKSRIEEGEETVLARSSGAELLDALKPSPSVKLDTELLLSGKTQQIGANEWIIYKPRWSAFFSRCR